MARTLLMATLQRALAEAERSMEPEDGSPGWLDRPRTRREVLQGTAAAVAAGTAWYALGCGSSPPPEQSEQIAIVGGGLAGLVCAHRLKQAGHRAIIHEASDRLGGRVWTIRGVFADGQIAEHGGELIDSGQVSLRRLIAELGLQLDNVIAGEKPGTGDVFHFNGTGYPVRRAVQDFGAIYPTLKRQLRETGYPTLHNRHKPKAVELDHISIADWIGEYVPGGLQSDLGKLLGVAYNTEFGADISDQTSLNLLYLLGYSGGGRLRLLGASNEKFVVQGGNDLVVQRLAAGLEGQIRMGSELTEIKRQSDGSYRLAFDGGGGTVVKAPQVVLALPFAVMRASVDFSTAGFDPVKTMAIEQQGMGTNSKLNVQFSNREWRTADANGGTYADTGYQSTWEASRGQPGRAGILVNFTGGTIGRDFGGATADERARRFLDQIDPVFPGVPATYNGRAVLDYWTGRPFTRGSYAYYRVGQMTAFAGVEGKPSGNCHFAGEQTSYTYQGYMEGAVKSGERAASEVIAARS